MLVRKNKPRQGESRERSLGGCVGRELVEGELVVRQTPWVRLSPR